MTIGNNSSGDSDSDSNSTTSNDYVAAANALRRITPPVLRSFDQLTNATVRADYKTNVFDKLHNTIQNIEFNGISGDPVVRFTGADISPSIYIA